MLTETTAARAGTPLTYQRIVVPLDGSELSEAALPHAETLARIVGAEVILIRAYEPPADVDAADTMGAVIGRGSLLRATAEARNTRHAADRYLEGVAERLRADGVSVDVAPLQGPPGRTIVREALGRGADLIVMATHARGGVGRVLAGSVADYVLRHASCPLFLVHPPLD